MAHANFICGVFASAGFQESHDIFASCDFYVLISKLMG
jgi:hypothetical protein